MSSTYRRILCLTSSSPPCPMQPIHPPASEISSLAEVLGYEPDSSRADLIPNTRAARASSGCACRVHVHCASGPTCVRRRRT